MEKLKLEYQSQINELTQHENRQSEKIETIMEENSLLHSKWNDREKLFDKEKEKLLTEIKELKED